MTERPPMRLNVHLDQELLARAMAATGLRTRKATIEEALRMLVRLREWAVEPIVSAAPAKPARKLRAKPAAK
jgi:metal-responsive CopG/Arc/MetJ family transcriptional regulator